MSLCFTPAIVASKTRVSCRQIDPQAGLKLFSTNLDLLPFVRALEPGAPFAFIELYVIPGSFAANATAFTGLSLPVIIHSPHLANGVNLADASMRRVNRKLMEDSFRFADMFDSSWIIAHGGMSGTMEEYVEQVREMNDHRIIIENLPLVNLIDEPSVGCTPEDVTFAMESGAFGGFVLDVGHALCAAATLKTPWEAYLERFLALDPCMFHIADGDVRSEKDMHLSLGYGNYDWDRILAKLPQRALVTLETPRDPARGLADSERDALFLRDRATGLCVGYHRPKPLASDQD